VNDPVQRRVIADLHVADHFDGDHEIERRVAFLARQLADGCLRGPWTTSPHTPG
jgi:hypothetical protein